MSVVLPLRRLRPLEERFWEKVDKTLSEKGCWLWRGQSGEYGKIYVHGQGLVKCHRLSYEMHKGPIPEGLLVRHTCDVKGCVNPDHLLVGTKKDNAHDAIERGQFVFVVPRDRPTHCKNGHLFTEENTRWRFSDGPKRACRICLRAYWEKRRLKLATERTSRPKKIILPPTHCGNGHPLTPENVYRWPSKKARDGWRWCCRVCLRGWRKTGHAKLAARLTKDSV